MKRLPALLLPLFGALAAPLPAPAAGPIHVDERAMLRLLAGRPGAEGWPRLAGLSIELAPGWKTYWRVPGEGGVPPAFDWSGSDNVAAVEVRWPAPRAFESWGLTSIGYEGAVTLPLEVRAEDPTRPVSLSLTLFYGICREVCIPGYASLALEIAPGDAFGAERVEAALATTPRSAAEAGVETLSCELAEDASGRRFAAALRLAEAPDAAPYAVVEGPEGVMVGPAEARLDGRALHVAAVLHGDAWLGRDSLRLTLIGPAGAVEAAPCP